MFRRFSVRMSHKYILWRVIGLARSQRIFVVTTQDGKEHVGQFKWSVSRGRDTYGWNICTAYIEGERVGRVNGGGYDMQGAALSPWVSAQAHFPKDQEKLPYGFYRNSKGAVGCDGACGLDTILRGIGAEFRWVQY